MGWRGEIWRCRRVAREELLRSIEKKRCGNYGPHSHQGRVFYKFEFFVYCLWWLFYILCRVFGTPWDVPDALVPLYAVPNILRHVLSRSMATQRTWLITVLKPHGRLFQCLSSLCVSSNKMIHCFEYTRVVSTLYTQKGFSRLTVP